MLDNIGISLLGAGNVGSSVMNTLLTDSKRFQVLIGANLKLQKVLVRDLNKYRKIFKYSSFTDNFSDILNDSKTQIVVEMLGGEDPAYIYIEELLKSGKHVVTANKDVMAKYGSKLITLAEQNKVSIRYEASVGGGIPIIGPLSRDLLANEIYSISAIINGTTNYMLTVMNKEKISYDEALLRAQNLGYAEPNPYNDVEGIDVSYKLAILCGLAFHADVNPANIYCEGISGLDLKDLEYANNLGFTIKLLARAELKEGKIVCIICPSLISNNAPLSKVDGVLNAIQLKGSLVGEVVFEGPGAGASPTSSAILGDVIDIAKNIKYALTEPTNNLLNKIEVSDISSFNSRYYIRLNVSDESGVLAAISGIMSKYSISIASVIQTEADLKLKTAQLILTTHEAKREKIDLAMEEISKEGKVVKICNLLPIVD
jgi:homoserine dehydrogenase